MWQIRNFEIKPAILDFSSSGQSNRQVSQLFGEGVQLMNALELMDWQNPYETQVLICEACGIVRCKSGGWVSFCRSESLVFMLPTEDYVSGDEDDKREYDPPAYLKQRGIPCFDFDTWNSLQSKEPSLPGVDEFEPLSLKDATLLFHWNDRQILGEPPTIHCSSDIIIGSSEGDWARQFEQLTKLISAQYATDSVAQMRHILDHERIISFYLDGAEFIEWPAMVFDGSEYRLLVDSAYVIQDTQPDET